MPSRDVEDRLGGAAARPLGAEAGAHLGQLAAHVRRMCSKKWAKPVRPGRSFFEPTWYHIWRCTIGVEWSSRKTTVMPLGSVVIV